MKSNTSITPQGLDAQASPDVGQDAAAYERMDPALKAKWVAALRSGEFTQCRGALHDGISFCCIGVGGHILGISREELQSKASYLGANADTEKVLGPLEKLSDLKARQRLASMNDDGKSFSEIADWIEANL
jgi:hypothetical protein